MDDIETYEFIRKGNEYLLSEIRIEGETTRELIADVSKRVTVLEGWKNKVHGVLLTFGGLWTIYTTWEKK